MTAASPASAPSPTDTVLAGLDAMGPWQDDVYRDLHRHPEIAHVLPRTSARVAELLRETSAEVHEGIGTCGVAAVLRNGDGPVVLARADMDALPVAERTGLDYASTATAEDPTGAQVPAMHACGHDVHTTALLSAVRLLDAARDQWSGTLIAVFQPAEEVGTGARAMVAGGLTDLVPAPEVALAGHVLPQPAGTVCARPGPFLSFADTLTVTVHGRGAHGSMPHLAVDPVVLAASIVMRLQGIVSREVSPLEFAVVTVGRIAAGTGANVIADSAVLELNCRSYSAEVRAQLLAAIERIVRAECAASGSPREPEFDYSPPFPGTINDEAVTARVADAFAAHVGAVRDFGRQTASEDFSDLPNAWGIPYCYWGVGAVDPETFAAAEAAGTVASTIPGPHSPFFAPVMPASLRTATRAMVAATMAWLGR